MKLTSAIQIVLSVNSQSVYNVNKIFTGIVKKHHVSVFKELSSTIFATKFMAA